MFIKKIISVLNLLVLVSCSAETNFNQLWVSKDQEQALDVILTKAQIAYDAFDYDEALKYGNKAYAINKNNADTIILLGYIYLAKAGIDVFTLADKLIQSDKSAKTALTSDADLLATSDAAKALSDLGKILGITDADLLKFGDINAGKSNLEYFKSYDIIVPKTASEARAADVQAVINVNKAISYICPLVEDSVKSSSDKRHNAENCPVSSSRGQLKIKAHFLWSFSHLTEAIAFYSVLMYQSATATKPNLESRIDVLNTNASKISVVDYVSYISELNTIIDKIFPTDDTDSMLKAVLSGLQATVAGFGQIAGLPDELKSSVSNGLNTIESQRTKVATAAGASNSVKDTKALKSQITKNVSSSLKTKITDYATSNPTEFAQNKTQLCSAFTQITEGTLDKPAECN